MSFIQRETGLSWWRQSAQAQAQSLLVGCVLTAYFDDEVPPGSSCSWWVIRGINSAGELRARVKRESLYMVRTRVEISSGRLVRPSSA